MLQFAAEEADRLLHNYIGTEHLLLGILREERSVAASILMEKGMRLNTVREDIVQLLNEKTTLTRVKETPLLAEFSRDLTESAMKNQLDPLVGRDHELERVQQVLCRRTKNNAVLIGEPGVGKTAIVEGLAQKIVYGDVPHFLADKRILALDISLIVAGTKYRGQFEERLKAIMKELTDNPNIIVFIDELHTLVGRGVGRRLARRGEHPEAGAVARRDPLHRRDDAGRVPQVHREGSVARAALPGHQGRSARRARDDRDPARRQGSLRELPSRRVHARGDRGRRVPVEPLHHRSVPARQGHRPGRRSRRARQAEGSRLQRGVRRDQQEHPRRRRADGERRLAEGLREGAVLPRAGSDGAREPAVRAREVRRQVERAQGRRRQGRRSTRSSSKWTGVPMASINQDEGDKLLRMEAELHKRVISQEKAISAISRAIRRSRAGLKNPKRPVGSFVFLGPTGVGKTELARALANFLFGSDHALIRFDMSEYMEKHSVSQADRIAARLRRARRGRPADREGEAQPVLRRAARRNREGAPGHLQHPAAGVRGRPPDRRPRAIV